MDCIHVKNLDKYHLDYKDRSLIWAKIYFSMVNGDPDWEMISSEIDKWRFVAFVCLELRAKKPIPLDNWYLTKNGFDLKKRPISMTLEMLHTFIEVRNITVTQSRVEESRVDKSNVTENKKEKHLDCVFLLQEELVKLTAKYGDISTTERIQRLNDYKMSTGKKYASDYHTILNWARKEENDVKARPKSRGDVLITPKGAV